MKIGVAIALGTIIASPLHAQDLYFPDMMAMNINMGNIALEHDRMSSLNDVGDTDNQRSPEREVAPSMNFQYRVSSQRRAANINQFVNVWAKTDPAGAAKGKALLPSAIPQIDQMMRTVGLRADNVADAYAVWWIAAWEAVNNRDMGSSAAMYNAVKAQTEAALAATPQMRSAGDAEKQQMAEAMLIQAALIAASSSQAAGNATQQAAISKAVNQGARKMGLDLTKMTLTQDGFVPRSGRRSEAGDGPDNTQLAADNTNAGSDGSSGYTLYAIAGTGLLAGMFAIGKGLAKRG